MGDFNKNLSTKEKWNSCLHPKKQMEEYRDALSDFDLRDLGFTRSSFTWGNRGG